MSLSLRTGKTKIFFYSVSSKNCLSFLSTYLLTVDAAQPVPGPELVPELAGRAARHKTRNHDPVGGEGRILALLLRLACPRKSQDSSFPEYNFRVWINPNFKFDFFSKVLTHLFKTTSTGRFLSANYRDFFRMNLTANPMDINPEVLCLMKKFSCKNCTCH